MNNNIPLTDVDAPVQEPEDQLELASIHDFATKLVQPGAKEALEHYVRWQVAMRNATDADAIDLDPSKVPDFAPISINLDLTTACNYACDHCVDLDILNTGIRFDHEKLLESIKVMAERGMFPPTLAFSPADVMVATFDASGAPAAAATHPGHCYLP